MNINDLGNRPMMYLFSDGVSELMIGLFMFSYAAAVSLISRMPKDWGYGWGGFAGPVLLAVCGFGMARGIKVLRQRVTAPRGGYVAPMVTPYQRLFWLFVFILGLGLSRFVVSSHLSQAVMWCAAFTLIYAITGLIYRIPYMFSLAALSTALCAWLTIKGGDLLFVMQWQGAMLAIAGGAKLWRFVRSHERA